MATLAENQAELEKLKKMRTVESVRSNNSSVQYNAAGIETRIRELEAEIATAQNTNTTKRIFVSTSKGFR